MRIDRPPYIMERDILCCIRCGKRNYKLTRDLYPGDLIVASSFKGVSPVPDIQNQAPLICFYCGESLAMRDQNGTWHFRSIERDAESHSKAPANKDGLEPN